MVHKSSRYDLITVFSQSQTEHNRSNYWFDHTKIHSLLQYANENVNANAIEKHWNMKLAYDFNDWKVHNGSKHNFCLIVSLSPANGNVQI